MSAPLIFAIPSKGRMKEQLTTWLSEAGLSTKQVDGPRGYTVKIDGLDGLELKLMQSGEISHALGHGDVHLGVTGQDLIQENVSDWSEKVHEVKLLGIGKADLLVATPICWADVQCMDDLDDVAAELLSEQNRPLRIATKYLNLARQFLNQKGIVNYRLVESLGATEGTPTSGAADIIIDITSSGATLVANHLHPVSDGLILNSQAVLAASLKANWSDHNLSVLHALLQRLDARERAQNSVVVRSTISSDDFKAVSQELIASGADIRTEPSKNEPIAVLHVPHAKSAIIGNILVKAGAKTTESTASEMIFDTICPDYDSFIFAMNQR